MSLAVATVVKPSTLLLALVAGMCIAVLFVACMVGLGRIGDLSLWARVLIGASCGVAAVIAFVRANRHRKLLRIDISGTGQIRLSYPAHVAPSYEQPLGLTAVPEGELMRLLPDSTLWSCLLLLRLESVDRRTTVVPILPDCVDRESFRALSVACRWIAAHNLGDNQTV